MLHRSPETYVAAISPPPRGDLARTVVLTPTEARVLALLATYRTLAAIGDELGIRRSTAKTHVQNIYRKLGAKTRAQAVERAESAGLIRDSRLGAMTAEAFDESRASR